MRLLALVKSFPVIQIKEIRPVVMAVLKNMSYIEDRQDNIFSLFYQMNVKKILFFK
jgi:hypothetical protein